MTNAEPVIVSINSAKSQAIEFNGQQVYTGIFKYPVADSVNVTALGLAGDTIVDKEVHGGLDQAVYLYHAEDYAWWEAELGRTIGYGTFGENLTIGGLDDISWVIGDRITINNVVLEITAPRIPCFKLGVRMDDASFVKKFARAVRPGAYARVISEGAIKTGDTLSIEKTAMDYASVKAVFSLWHSKEKPVSMLKKVLASPVASVHRQRLQNWYKDTEA